MNDFDRIKSRSEPEQPRGRGPMPAPRADSDGKHALFSQQPPALSALPFGALSLTCSTCRTTTAMTVAQVLTAAVPSLHLPVLRRDFPSWMRCPACRRRTWVRLRIRRVV